MARRLSHQAAAVLAALAAEPTSWRYGYELGLEVELKAGSLYPILIRLSDRGLLESSWENGPPTGRPPRHLYRLTAAGVHAAVGVQIAAEVKPTLADAAPDSAPQTARDVTLGLPAIRPRQPRSQPRQPRSAW